MAVTYGFYDSLNHDRLYNAKQMSAIFDGIINDGVFDSVGNQFHTVAGSGMQVIVKSGRAWFNSTWTLNDAEYPLTIDAADVLLTRIDAVVIEVNSEQATRANSIKVVKGTPASSPAKPTLTNTSTVHQHALAYVTIAKNTTAITNSMIEIVVGKTETPYVTAILQTTDITDLYKQWEDYFQTWFDTVRGTLDGDVALNLQNQITTLRRETLLPTTPPKIGLSSSATGDDMFNVLCKVGDLHVWKKTTIIKAETPYVPPTYTLGSAQSINFATNLSMSSSKVPTVNNIYVSNTIIVANDGTVSLVSPTTIYINISLTAENAIKNAFNGYKYFKLESGVTYGNNCSINAKMDVIYLLNDSSRFAGTSDTYGDNALVGLVQEVTGVGETPEIPAEIAITYPVSTKHNAYQEGSDEKSAGYTLGDVVTGSFSITPKNNGSQDTMWRYASSATNNVIVDDDGNVSFSTNTDSVVTNGGNSNAVSTYSVLKGKYASFAYSMNAGSNKADLQDMVVFFPSDTIFSQVSDCIVVDRYRPVIGYAAIPASTTITYLGCLGEKNKIQLISYVGTGTYGAENPASITADFPIQVIIVLETSAYCQSNGYRLMINTTDFTSSYVAGNAPFFNTSNYTLSSSTYGKLSPDRRTLSWYNIYGNYPSMWFNEATKKYSFLVIG